jgi:predicted nucleotidyltransferase component of viral defense system
MDALVPSQVIEQFHLLFLAHLARGVDKRSLVVKGGCNLRFFHRSIRYSEDMDLDVQGIEEHPLRDRVRGLLASRPFRSSLGSRGVEIEHVTEHKQTPVVQRWKLGLRAEGLPRPLPTKIEFSRRGLDDGVEFGSLDPGLIAVYRLAPFMVSHYGAAAALRQKVGALAHRTETQARDIFDLHHLLASGAPAVALREAGPDVLAHARARATSIDFGVFKSQVLSFLPLEEQSRYDSADAWETMVLEVLEALDGAAA